MRGSRMMRSARTGAIAVAAVVATTPGTQHIKVKGVSSGQSVKAKFTVT
jgi:hypothetical protein